MTRDDWLAIGVVHEPLFRLDGEGKAVINLLREPPTPTKRAREWRCRLREDVFFHSGKPVSSKDVVATFKRLKDTRFGWIPQALRVKRTGKASFTVRSRRALTIDDLGEILASPALSILPAKWDQRTGVGPFRIRQWRTASDAMTLDRYEEHHRGSPYLESVVFRRLPDERRVREEFRVGGMDVVFLDSLHSLDRLPDSPFQTGIRVTGQHAESIGLLVHRARKHISTSDREMVRAAATRTTVRDNLTGKTRIATHWIPKAVAAAPKIPTPSGSFKTVPAWKLVCPQPLKEACRALAVGTPTVLAADGKDAGPWPMTLLSKEQVQTAQSQPSTAGWDALLLSVFHIDPWKRGALSSLATLKRASPTWYRSRKEWNTWTWLPLIERRLFMVHSPHIKNLRWAQASFSDLGEVWIQ